MGGTARDGISATTRPVCMEFPRWRAPRSTNKFLDR